MLNRSDGGAGGWPVLLSGSEGLSLGLVDIPRGWPIWLLWLLSGVCVSGPILLRGGYDTDVDGRRFRSG